MYPGLYITNYCDKRCNSFHSITRLSESEALLLADDLSQHVEPSFTSFSRFQRSDFPGYYKKRVRTEKWLYDSFLALNGEPKTSSPLYFVLGESTYLENWYKNGIKTQLPLDIISPSEISFTIGDSMGIIDKEDRIEPLTKEGLLDFISNKSNDIFSFLHDLNKNNRYIEVQLWNDSYIPHTHNDSPYRKGY